MGRMALKDVDIGAVLHRLADRKIEQAMREGKFDRIAGMGKPLDLEPLPADENARMRWWALKILRQNDVTPDEVVWRKQIDGWKEALERATTEDRVRTVVDRVNALVRRLNTLGTNAVNLPVAPVSVDDELAKLRGRQAAMRVAAGAAAASAAEPAAEVFPVVPAPDRRTGPVARLFGLVIRTCGDERCRSRNPAKAVFCRRCGGRLS